MFWYGKNLNGALLAANLLPPPQKKWQVNARSRTAVDRTKMTKKMTTIKMEATVFEMEAVAVVETFHRAVAPLSTTNSHRR